jgi:hypothetical protein
MAEEDASRPFIEFRVVLHRAGRRDRGQALSAIVAQGRELRRTSRYNETLLAGLALIINECGARRADPW